MLTFQLRKQSLLLFLMIGFLFFAFLAAVVVTSVQNILLFFLALRRFLIFFVPNAETRLLFHKGTFNRVLLTLYAFYSSLPVAYTVAKRQCLESVNTTTERINQNDTIIKMNSCEQTIWKLYSVNTAIPGVRDFLNFREFTLPVMFWL